jgi:GNAT superfamily N-acetyltransferase
MDRALRRPGGSMTGMVALTAEGEAVGWMKQAPAALMGKLYDQRLYRGLPCFDSPRESTETIGCFLVDERWRRHGVASALLTFGIQSARRRGARAVEAFPRRAEGVSDAEYWMGPVEVFVRAGFRVIHDFGPYPVLRLAL